MEAYLKFDCTFLTKLRTQHWQSSLIHCYFYRFYSVLYEACCKMKCFLLFFTYIVVFSSIKQYSPTQITSFRSYNYTIIKISLYTRGIFYAIQFGIGFLDLVHQIRVSLAITCFENDHTPNLCSYRKQSVNLRSEM